MTVNEIMEQVQALDPDERAELTRRLLEMETTWTDEELEDLLADVEPLTGAEIVAAGLTGGWADLDIPGGAEWVEQQRKKRRERHQW